LHGRHAREQTCTELEESGHSGDKYRPSRSLQPSAASRSVSRRPPSGPNGPSSSRGTPPGLQSPSGARPRVPSHFKNCGSRFPADAVVRRSSRADCRVAHRLRRGTPPYDTRQLVIARSGRRSRRGNRLQRPFAFRERRDGNARRHCHAKDTVGPIAASRTAFGGALLASHLGGMSSTQPPPLGQNRDRQVSARQQPAPRRRTPSPSRGPLRPAPTRRRRRRPRGRGGRCGRPRRRCPA